MGATGKLINLSSEQISYLLQPEAIRERANRILNLAIAGKTHFEYHPEKLKWVVDYVLQVIQKKFMNWESSPWDAKGWASALLPIWADLLEIV